MVPQRPVPQVLEKMNFNARFLDINRQIESTKFDTKVGNNARRKLYAIVELLRIEFQEQCFAANVKQDDPNVLEIEEKLKQMGSKLALDTAPIPTSLVGRAFMIFRFVTLWSYFCFAFLIMQILIPLRWIHPMLRRVGVQNDYLPFDFIQVRWSALTNIGNWCSLRIALQRYFGKSLLWCVSVQVEVIGRHNMKGNGIPSSLLCMFRYARAYFVKKDTHFSEPCIKFGLVYCSRTLSCIIQGIH